METVKFKPVSHFQKCNDPTFKKSCNDLFRPVEKRLKIYEELDEKNGILIRKSEYCTIDRKKEMENYRCSDFSLENILRSGVSIQICKLNSSNFSMLDNLEIEVEKLSNNIKQSQTNNL